MAAGVPDLSGLVNDKDFQGLSPSDQRKTLFGVTKDSSFQSLSDGDTLQFISRMRGMNQPQPAIPQVPNGVQGAPPQAPPSPIQQGTLGKVVGAAQDAYATAAPVVKSMIPQAPPQPQVPSNIMTLSPDQQKPYQEAYKNWLAGQMGSSAQLGLGFVGGGKLASKIPSKANAEAMFEDVSKVADKLPVNLTRTEPALQELKSYVDAAGQMPRGMSKFFKRLDTLQQNPMTYEEARKFYMNVSKLTAEDVTRLSGPIKRQMALTAQAFKADIGDTAAAAGKQSEYYGAMKEYARAAKWKQTAINIAKYVGIPTTAAAVGYEAKNLLK